MTPHPSRHHSARQPQLLTMVSSELGFTKKNAALIACCAHYDWPAYAVLFEGKVWLSEFKFSKAAISSHFELLEISIYSSLLSTNYHHKRQIFQLYWCWVKCPVQKTQVLEILTVKVGHFCYQNS